ncbi:MULTISPECIES: PTS sugar transporter subunit IIA [unclassified Clostridium]|uniref:PTS sugar transporter subunit IIA n=1 Tax=unclassified Clostridium TaxID=2614128 RepID=UPI0018997C36|nr:MULTISPECIES: PTS sugar transporter subunit IIA [unclassified Clostridium]MCR1952105.1 PTS sugar transporter subunit IIA [Clostridium sp. DSM 100503]
MNNDLIFINENYNDCFEFLENISDRLLNYGYVKESFKDAIIEREKIFPTGLPVEPIGVAIPHCNSEHVNKAGIVFVKFKDDVKFISMEGEGEVNVKIAFVLLVKEKEKQVEVLQKLMEVISNEDILTKMYNENNNDNLINIMKEVGLR